MGLYTGRRVALGCLILLVLCSTGTAATAGGHAGSLDADRPPANVTDGVTPSAPDGGPVADHGGHAVDAVAERQQAVRPDPATDRLGWENGRWYNESLTVDRSDGLNDSELDAVVNRSMARVEQVRRLEFERSVPVDVISREELDVGNRNTTYPENYRLAHNTKWEAVFMVDEPRDSISVQQGTSSATIGGYYSPSEERIVVVSENASAPKMDEITLSQELFHALQDRKFDIGSYDQSTTESHNAIDGIIEGDGNYVDWLYERRCAETWDCLLPQGQSGGGGDNADIHYGMLQITLQPYSDGPAFVRDIRQSGGWDAVDDVYDAPPESTEQVIHPGKYRTDSPTNPTIDTRPTGEWSRLETLFGPSYAVFGEAGMAAMLFNPYFDSDGFAAPLIGPGSYYNLRADGTLNPLNSRNYSNVYTSGWDGDRLVPYATADSASTNETGYIWKTEWDSATDVTQFRTGYERLLRYYGAQSTGEDTWRIPEDEAFGDAFRIDQSGTTLTIVNGPTEAALSEIRPRDSSDDTLPALPDAAGPPTNLDSDPLLEDVDGDGRGTVFDALTYYNNRDNETITGNTERFDFDGDGQVGTVFDALALYEELS